MPTAPKAKEQFLVDGKGRRVGVLLDIATYDRLRAAAEDRSDVRAYDAAAERVRREVEAGAVLTLAEFRARRARRIKA